MNLQLIKNASWAILPLTVSLSTVYAQEAEQNSQVDSLDESVIFSDVLSLNQVNAFKTSTPILDVPQSLSLFSAEQIKDQGVRDIGDIIDYTPGVNTSQGEGHRDSVVFRGVRSTADFFVDGVRDDVQYYRPLYNVEQVEILRGPNALVFGRGGTGGVLNRVMKKAEIGEDFSEYQASIDSFGETLLQFDTNYTLNDQMAFRLNMHYDNLANHRDHYDGTRLGFNPTFTYSPTEETEFRFSLEVLDHERFIDRGIPTGADGKPVSGLADTVFGDSDLNTTTLEAYVLRFDVDHQFSDNWKGSATASFGSYDKFYQNFYASDYDETTDVVSIDGYADQTKRENLILSGNLVGEFELGGLEHKLLVGAEFNQTSSNQDRYNSDWTGTSDDVEFFSASDFSISNGVGVNSSGIETTNSFNTDLNDDTHVDITAFSFYLQDEIAVTDYLDVILGARFDSFDIQVNDREPGGVKSSRKDQEVSPRLGLVLKPIENVSFYGSYSESFLPRSGEQYANIGDDDRLDPNTFSNLEIGVKWDIKDDLNFTLSAFEIEQSSQEVSDADASQLVTIDSKIRGLEAQLKGQITDQWFVSAGASYLDAEQIDQSGDTGLYPREIPQFTFSVWNKYQVNEKLGLGLGFIYQDESFVNNDNTAELPSYIRVDASAYYQISDNLRVQLNVENLFDTDYYPNAHSTHQVTVGAPINARLGFVGSF